MDKVYPLIEMDGWMGGWMGKWEESGWMDGCDNDFRTEI